MGKTFGLLDIYHAILSHSHSKARSTVAEHFGDDHQCVVQGDWYAAGDQLPEDAPWRVKNAVGFLCCFEGFCNAIEAGEERAGDALIYAFELGHTSAYVELESDLPTGVDRALESYRKRQEGVREGGKATKRLTPDQEIVARNLIAEKQTPGVSKTAACTRTAADLKKDHNIDVSKETLLRLLRNGE